MKTCPLYDTCCPYLVTHIDSETGEWIDAYCTLTNPEKDCDDYAAMLDNDKEDVY